MTYLCLKVESQLASLIFWLVPSWQPVALAGFQIISDVALVSLGTFSSLGNGDASGAKGIGRIASGAEGLTQG